MPELLVILVVALLVLGPKRLPEVAKALGKAMGEFRRATAGISEEIETARLMLEEEARKATTEASRTIAPPTAAAGTAPRAPAALADRAPSDPATAPPAAASRGPSPTGGSSSTA